MDLMSGEKSGQAAGQKWDKRYGPKRGRLEKTVP
jgi:hypothetical protein